MKKTLLSIALIGAAFVASSQDLMNDNFNSYAVGSNLTTTLSTTASGVDASGQGNWKVYAYDTQVSDTSFKIKTFGSNDNYLKITGTNQANANPVTRTRNLYKSFDWTSRTSGNNVLFSSFVFGSGKANSSRNVINFAIFNSAGNVILRYQYNKALKTLTPGCGGINPSTSAPAIASFAPVTLEDEKMYYCELIYDANSKKTYFFVLDVTGASPVVKLNMSGAAFTDAAQIALYNSPKDFYVYVSAQYDATANAASSEFILDDVLVQARPCVDYATKASASFSYPAGNYCLGGANLTPVLVAPSSKGTFTSTNGLTLNATTGVVGLGSTTTAGTYTVKFVTTDPYVAATATTQGVDGACPDSSTVSITIKNCAGIEEIIENKFSIYPNPANDVVTVSLGDLVITEGTIRLLSADGKVIESRVFNNSTIENFDVTSLKSGIYFFQIGNTTEKFIIK